MKVSFLKLQAYSQCKHGWELANAFGQENKTGQPSHGHACKKIEIDKNAFRQGGIRGKPTVHPQYPHVTQE